MPAVLATPAPSQLSVSYTHLDVYKRQQLDLFDHRRAVQSAQLEQPRHRPIDQRRANRTFAYRKKFVRSKSEVAQRKSGVPRTAGFAGLEWKLRRSLHLQPRPIAVVPGSRRMQANPGFQLDLRDPLQRLAENFSLEFQFPIVGDVLVMASAALLKVRTASFDAVGRGFDQLRNGGAREAGFLLPDFSFDPLPRQHKGHKDSHTASVGAGWRARQAVTAVDQFFDREQQVVSVARALLPAPDDASL